jgi:hypothetical protein
MYLVWVECQHVLLICLDDVMCKLNYVLCQGINQYCFFAYTQDPNHINLFASHHLVTIFLHLISRIIVHGSLFVFL